MPEDHSLNVGLEVDGSPLDDALRPLIDEVVVDDYLHQPDMVTIRFLDIGRTVVSDARIRIGSKLKVTATPLGGQSPQPLIEAEVTAIEADYTPSGSLAIVRAYDPLHRFQRGRQTQTYLQMKDSEIAQQIAQRADVDVGEITESDHPVDYVAQTNETDWAFLQRRAREIGYQIGADEGKFTYTKTPDTSDAPEEGDLQDDDPRKLALGRNLLEFHPRLSSSEQVGDVQVRGWDMTNKQAVVGRAQAAAGSASLQDSPASLAQIFGNPTFTSVDRPLSDQASVDATAKAIADRIGSAFAEAVGVARGHPALAAGVGVSVVGVAPEFNGKYVITSARHVFAHDGYKTKFAVSGQLDRSMLGLTTAGLSMRPDEAPVNGVAIGIVTANVDTQDPDAHAGMVKVKLPWLADSYESTWVRVVSLGAGPDSGAVWLPQVNDEVLLAFDHGDMRRPFVLGGLWNGQDKPPLGDGLFDNGSVKRRGFVSRKGHKIVFFDSDNDAGVALLTADQKYKVALNQSETKIHIKSDGTIEIESTQDITIKSSAGISIEATGQLKLKGSGGVKIEGSAGVDIDGTPITLN